MTWQAAALEFARGAFYATFGICCYQLALTLERRARSASKPRRLNTRERALTRAEQQWLHQFGQDLRGMPENSRYAVLADGGVVWVRGRVEAIALSQALTYLAERRRGIRHVPNRDASVVDCHACGSIMLVCEDACPHCDAPAQGHRQWHDVERISHADVARILGWAHRGVPTYDPVELPPLPWYTLLLLAWRRQRRRWGWL